MPVFSSSPSKDNALSRKGVIKAVRSESAPSMIGG